MVVAGEMLLGRVRSLKKSCQVQRALSTLLTRRNLSRSIPLKEHRQYYRLTMGKKKAWEVKEIVEARSEPAGILDGFPIHINICR